VPKIVLLWTDAAMWLLVLALAVYIVSVLRKPALAASWRKVFADGPALASSVILLVCLLITLLDSVHFRAALPPAAGSTAGSVAYETRTRSLLDVALRSLSESRETTYSRPLAYESFTKETVDVGGQPARVAPRLVHGGVHLIQPETQWAGDITRRVLLGLLLGLAFTAALTAATVGAVATAAAGFRHQFYGVLDHLTEGGEGAPLVTVGLIDPLHCAWGERTTRIGGRTWQRPTVDVSALDPSLRAWFTARRVPKLLVAGQTKVVEVIVDEAGALLPSVPVITVEAPADRLWDLAAALSSPPVAAWAFERALGTGLSADTIRLSAKLLLEVPLPTDRRAWTRATAALRASADLVEPDDRRAALVAYGRQACRAYRVDDGGDDGLLAWWSRRLP